MKKIALFLAMAVAALACTPEETVTPELKVLTEASELVAPQAESQVYIDFETNVAWTATIEANDWSVLSPNPATGEAGTHKLTVTCLANGTNDSRTVKVTITAQDKVEEVVITQAQKDALTVGEKTFTVPAEGGNVEFTVAHNVEFTATTEADWLTRVETKAMEETKVVFEAAENTGVERTATIVVSDGTLSENITVTQAAWVPQFEVSPAEDQWLPLEGGSVEFTVAANIEYTVELDENEWLTMTEADGVYTFTATANADFTYRSVAVYVTPTDEAYVEYAKTIYMFQNGRVSKLWGKTVADFEGYDASLPARLAAYGDKILFANTTKVYVLDPSTGEIESTINMPEGVLAHSVLVDDAGNFMIAANAGVSTETKLYLVPDPTNPQLETVEEILSYHSGNYYANETGNFRVKGNVKDDAVITAVASTGAADCSGGAILMWEVVDGVCGDWKWTPAPFTDWTTDGICCLAVGNTISDGLFYIGYGGDYNLQYTANPVFTEASEWVVSYVTGSAWMENYNCISTAEWKGDKYAAIVMGCHFAYDAADAVLLNVNDPAAAQFVYKHQGDGDVAWDWAAGVNPSWTGLGTFSDVLLVPTEDALLMLYADTNYGAIACISIK